MTPQEELQALRRLAELEAKAGPSAPSVATPSKPLGPPEQLSWAEKNIAPLLESAIGSNPQGSPFGRVVQGAADAPIGVMQLAGNAMGLGDVVNQRVTDLEKGYQQQRSMAGSTGFDPMRLAGNLGTAVLAPGATAAPKAGALANLLRGTGTGIAFGSSQPVVGARSGKLSDLVTGEQPTSFWGEKLKQAGLGGIFGALGVPVSAALARIVRPQTNPAARMLMDEGVDLTPGQIMGGTAKRIEDAATSIPVLGDIIKGAQTRSVEGLNRAAMQRALTPIGEDASKLPVGPEGILAVKKKLGDAYDALLPKLSFDVRTIAPDISNLRSMVAQGLPQKEADQFTAILDKNLGQMPKGVADGQTFKDIVSNLRTESKSFGASTDTYQRKLGDALGEAEKAFREGLKLSNPTFAKELAGIDEGYANYTRLRAAGASAGDKSSGFSPAQLAAAVRGQDKSVGKGQTATGQALMQDLSDAARSVLPSSVPDSGTPLRSAISLLGGVGGALAGGNAAMPGLAMAALGPAAATVGAGGLAAIPYTQLGGKAMQKLLAERPEYATQIAQLLRQGGPLATAAAAPALTNGL